MPYYSTKYVDTNVRWSSVVIYCLGVIGPLADGGAPCSPRSSSPLSPGPLTGLVSVTGNFASPLPSASGGVVVPGPPRRSQSRNEPLYSPTFWYLKSISACIRWGARRLAHPAWRAIPAAALLRTPALQKNTISLLTGGFWKPNLS
jgi:hypothetical protein